MTTDISEVIHTLESHDCVSEVSFSDALNIVRQETDLAEYIQELDPNPEAVATLITFDNSHDVAYYLATSKLDTAKALYEELKYYSDIGRF